MDGQVTGTTHSDSYPQLWMTVGRSVSAKSTKMTRRFEWTPRASSSWNRIWEGIGSKEDDAPEQRGYWDGADLHLGAIDTTNETKREEEKERQSEKSQSNSNITSILKREYICMGNARTCDMQKKLHHGLSPIQSYQHTINLHTSKCMIVRYNAYMVQCKRF